jgi:glutaryl-CoA dehydrogenase
MELDLRLDSLFTEEERILRATARRFVENEVLPVIAEAYEAGRFPRELVGPLSRLGLIGMKVHGYECAGMSNVAYGIACEELEAGDSGLRSFMSVMNSLFMYPVESFGTEEQKRRWLPAMARGEALGCFGLTEAHGGSDPASNKTHARRSGGDWIINGSKMWITNGSIADVALV